MKKYLGFILVLTMIFVSGISSASAQLNIVNVKEPCTFYYPNVPWDGPKTKIMVIEPENCIYIIKYYTRVAGGREELQIVGIYQIYKENDPCPSHVDIKRLDTKYVWDNDELFGDDNSQYVVSESNCAQAYVPNPDDDIHIDFPERDMEVLFAFPLTPIITQNNYYALPVQSVIFEPCGTACCMMYYDVVRDDNPPHKILKVNWYDPGLGSTYQEPCPSIINCTTNCESLKWNWEESLGFV